MKWGDKELVVFDLECDNLLFEVTKIYCLCYCKVAEPNKIYTLTDYEDIKKFFLNPNYYRIAHNGLLFDCLVAEKILNISISTDFIDTLFISWIIFFERNSHGLEKFGEDFGVEKPKIEDWKNLTIEKYSYRCQEDVKINYLLWMKQYKFLMELYEDEKQVIKFIKYLTFKGVCIQYQLRQGITLDEELCKKTLEELLEAQKEKIVQLESVMPKVPIKSKRAYPKVMYKKDGEISEIGKKWMLFLKEQNLPENTTEVVEYISGYEEPNGNSPEQQKAWLYSLGWVPDNIQFKRDKKTNKIKQIPQIKHPVNAGEVSDSVKELFDKEPNLQVLEGLGIINHRIGVFKGFLRDQIDGKLYPTISGITNTFRVQHSIIQNLVNVKKPYGKQIRGCLIASDDNHVLIGSDLKNIESMTRNHYIYKYDPQYVKDMDSPDFDSHWDIAKLAGFVTQEQIDQHNRGEVDFGEARQKGKVVNFSAVYGVKKETLSRNSKLSLEDAQKLLDIYWQRNHAVQKFADSLPVKTLYNKLWIKNPISGFYHNLRALKDKFSTVNQSSAVFCFDIWVSRQIKLGVYPLLGYHDEIIAETTKENLIENKDKIKKAIKQTNDLLKLNVTLDCDVKSDFRYSDCH